MSALRAVGAYLKTLREERELSQETVGDQLGVNKRQVLRWEIGENEPSTTHLLRMLELYHGDMRDIEAIYRKSEPTVAYAKKLALDRSAAHEERTIAENLTDEEINKTVREMHEDDRFLDAVRAIRRALGRAD